MSYSRWLESYWYTFWCVHPYGSVEDRENAIFEVCDWWFSLQLTAADIRADVNACVEKARAACHTKPIRPTDEDLSELRGYMLEFVADVDAKYPLNH